jgi:hypothetical protein
MTIKAVYPLLFGLILLLIVHPPLLHLIHVDAVKFAVVPFDNIPIARINTDYGEYKLDADFSMDYGDETVVEKNSVAKSNDNMTFDNKVNGSTLQLECDSNDNCGTSLAPMKTKIYLVSSDLGDNEIANNSISGLEIKSNDCGNLSIQDCANFDFTIPSDMPLQNYKFVVDISFDEARWIFINPLKMAK